MLILLPPSEGKTKPGIRRAPFNPADLSWPELSDARDCVVQALAHASARDDALDVLGVGPSLLPEVQANCDLASAAAAPAWQVYSGVLYEALSFATLSPAGRRRANRSLVIISAVWGALRLNDRIPSYRLSMSTALPPLGSLATYWRPHLAATLPGAQPAASAIGVVVDVRSSPYQAAWRPHHERLAPTVAVRVFRWQAGRRVVVSHLAKLTRGQVVRHLLERPGPEPCSPTALAAALAEAFSCELHSPSRPELPWNLDVIAT